MLLELRDGSFIAPLLSFNDSEGDSATAVACIVTLAMRIGTLRAEPMGKYGQRRNGWMDGESRTKHPDHDSSQTKIEKFLRTEYAFEAHRPQRHRLATPRPVLVAVIRLGFD
ncbi:conserved hypothetical protein [Coccidioides posadasii str. Silveira]|uniref:Uncharacterized protein n=1 Tax=Coccidioides posadasii (strain RMSCC 757 / Silveira) TaxID=443226 RepID=E9CV52_COCPS|nr:conserved hypothetical protein [Coccidioides posadasii str. Silveira]